MLRVVATMSEHIPKALANGEYANEENIYSGEFII